MKITTTSGDTYQVITSQRIPEGILYSVDFDGDRRSIIDFRDGDIRFVLFSEL